MSRVEISKVQVTYPYFGMPKITIPAEEGTTGSCAVMFAIVWFQLFSQVSPRSALYAKFKS